MATDHFDCFCVPSFYATNVIVEPAGGGNVRIWNCIVRRGELVPVSEVVFPAINLLEVTRLVMETAEGAFIEEKRLTVAAH